MGNDQSWQKTLDAFLADNPPSEDTRVLARALANSEHENTGDDLTDIADVEHVLHIEQNLDAIGLQPLPRGMEKKLQAIAGTNTSKNVIWNSFTINRQQLAGIAATIAVVALTFSFVSQPTSDQQPSLAEIKQAERELVVALQYLSIAQTKSADKIQQTLDENLQRPLNQSLLRPLNHFKESS